MIHHHTALDSPTKITTSPAGDASDLELAETPSFLQPGTMVATKSTRVNGRDDVQKQRCKQPIFRGYHQHPRISRQLVVVALTCHGHLLLREEVSWTIASHTRAIDVSRGRL